jgi:hypothetical protein
MCMVAQEEGQEQCSSSHQFWHMSEEVRAGLSQSAAPVSKYQAPLPGCATGVVKKKAFSFPSLAIQIK